MIDALFGNANYLAAKKMLDVNVLRHDAIASNLANIETPNYKRLDVSASFETQMQRAIAGGDPNQIAALKPEMAVDYAANSGRSDGNTVTLEDELLRLNQNVVEHALGTQLVSGSLSNLRMAITGKS